MAEHVARLDQAGALQNSQSPMKRVRQAEAAAEISWLTARGVPAPAQPWQATKGIWPWQFHELVQASGLNPMVGKSLGQK